MNLSHLISQLTTELGMKTEFTVLLLTMALLLSRLLPVVILSPFLGGEVVPTEVKLGIGLTLGVVLFPSLGEQMTRVPTSALPYLALLLKELFVGLCLSFIVSLVFEAAQVAGTLIDTMAGTTMAQVMVPQIQQQVSLFASLKLQLSVVLFLTLNGHHRVILAFSDSLSAIPLDRFPAFHAGIWPFFDLIIHTFADLLGVALSLAAPVFLAAFLTDLALGMINRVAPQVQVFFISMQIKPMVTALMMLVSVHVILQRLTLEFGRLFERLSDAIRLLS